MTQVEREAKEIAKRAWEVADANPGNMVLKARAEYAQSRFRREYLMWTKGLSYEQATARAFFAIRENEPSLVELGALHQGGGRFAR